MAICSQEEQEHIEFFRDLFQRYSPLIVSMLVMLMLIFTGHYLFRWYHNKKDYQALSYYSLFQKSLRDNNLSQSRQALSYLQSNFSSSPYTYLSSLSFASEAVRDDKPGDAMSILSWVVRNGGQPWSTIAILRVVPIAIDLGQYGKAKDFLSMSSLPEFKPLILMERGDVESAMKNYSKARDLYKSAIVLISNRASVHNKSRGVHDAELQNTLIDLLEKRIRYVESVK